MTQQLSPFLEGKYGWDYGENGWNTGMDDNLVKFSFMFDRNVDGIVATLPSVVNGQAWFNSTDKRLYFAVGGTFYSSPTPKWFEFVIKSTGQTYQYNGTTAEQIDSPADISTRLDAVELTLSELGTAAMEDTSYFASQAALDISNSQNQNYTDTLASNLANPTIGSRIVGSSVLVVGSIPALLSTATSTNYLVQVTGYHTGSTVGGGRVRYWSATTPKTTHNGGTIIDPTKSFPTDWTVLADVQAWFTPNASGTGCWVMQDSGGVYYPTEFGAKGDGTTNDQPAYASCASSAPNGSTIVFTPTSASYRMHWFFGYDNKNVRAFGARIDLFKLVGGPTVLAAAGSNARYEGVYLNCLETNLPNVRTTFEDRVNSYWYKCSFVGFRDAAAPDLNNAWGTYFKRADNITLDNCYFENNSQNDIAILEGSTNINIISPSGPALNINIEPNNDTLPVRGVKICNSKISILSAQENSFTGNSCNNILVEECDIQTLYYDGAGIEFIGCRIVSILPKPDGVGRCYGGALKLNGSVGISSNLIRDPNLVSVSATDPSSNWLVYTSTLGPTLRYAGITTSTGRGLRMNPTNVSGTDSIRSESVPVVAGGKYLLTAITSANYPTGAGQIAVHFGVRWLNSSSVDISNTICPINRAPVPTASPTSTLPSQQTVVLVAPVGAAFAQVLLGSTLASATTASTDWYSVGLHAVTEGYSGNTIADPLNNHSPVRGALSVVAGSMPSTTPTQYYYRDYEQGDTFRFINAVAGGYVGGICTVSGTSGAGTPGTFQGFGRVNLSGSATYDPPSLADGVGVTTTVTVTGAALGDFVSGVSFSLDLQGITLTGWVSAANTVSVRLQNESGGVLDLASGTLRAVVAKSS